MTPPTDESTFYEIRVQGHIDPDYVIPGHCTGRTANHAIERALPQAFIPGAVGTVYRFGAG